MGYEVMSTDPTVHWKEAALQDLVVFQRGFDITKAEQKEGDVPIISSSGVSSFHSEAKVAGPGVIIGRKGSLGTIHFSDVDYWPHDTTLWSKHFKGNSPRFVYYFLHMLHLERFDVGSSNPTLNRNHIHGLKIRIPPVEVQKEIADLLSTYDVLIENNRRRIELLERSAYLLYREWFVYLRFPGHEHIRVADGVPEGWERKRIDEVAETVGGGTPKTKIAQYWEGGTITWFVPSDLTKNDCLVLLDSERKITEAGLRNSSAKMLPPETILMSSRASLGFFGLYDGPSCTNQGFISVIPNEPYTQMYLLHNLMYRKDEIEQRAGGTTYKEINKSTFRSMEIVMPPESLSREFQTFAYDVVRQVRLIKKQNQKLRKARDLLLPRLMRGDVTL